jgi:hypothetical protein
LIALQLTPVVLSLLVLGAHFLRAGNPVLMALALVLMSLLVVPRTWAARVVQIALVLGAVEWTRTLIRIATQRAQEGEPYLRLAIILGGVALVTALSSLVFRTARLRSRYSPGSAASHG